MSPNVAEAMVYAGSLAAALGIVYYLWQAGRRKPYHTLEEMMIATLPLRPAWPPTLASMATSRRETAMTRPDHTLQLQALLECLKDICVEMSAASWEDIPEHPSTDRTRGFLLSTARLVECFPDQPRRGHYLASESELVKAAHTARRVLQDPIPEVAPVLDRIRTTLEEMSR